VARRWNGSPEHVSTSLVCILGCVSFLLSMSLSNADF
jgi:hypothetical protein